MNLSILAKEVQDYIAANLNADVSKIALSKSPFEHISPAELANQIAAKKKAEKKLSTWFKKAGIYFPTTLSVEQTSSEETAAYKQQVVKGKKLIDITAGFGVDSFYFSQVMEKVYSCEINPSLSAIAAHNAHMLGRENIYCLAVDGLAYLQQNNEQFDTIYVDPARRSTSGKVFKLADCSPNVIEHLDLLFDKAQRIVIKTSPLLDLQAGLATLKNVSEIHIVSVKNECKELLWVLDRAFNLAPKVICVTLNEIEKKVILPIRDVQNTSFIEAVPSAGYLYEADAALMKSGAFNAIANRFGLQKLDKQSHLYFSTTFIPSFIGRVFEIQAHFPLNELKKEKGLQGNVIVRNFPERAENLVKKLKIKPNKDIFYIFTQLRQAYVVFETKILQYY